MQSLVTRRLLALSLVGLVSLLGAENPAHGQGTIYGTGAGVSPGGRDAHWNIVAYPTGFTPPSGQSSPYAAYVPTSVPGVFVGGAGNDGYDGARWIAPQGSDESLVSGNYNWIAAQQFVINTTQTYRFSFQGAGDNELEFSIDGTGCATATAPTTGSTARATTTGGTPRCSAGRRACSSRPRPRRPTSAPAASTAGSCCSPSPCPSRPRTRWGSRGWPASGFHVAAFDP